MPAERDARLAAAPGASRRGMHASCGLPLQRACASAVLMLGILCALLTLGLGFGLVRLARLEPWLAPGAGLAVMVVLATWSASLGIPPSVTGVVLLMAGLTGWFAQRRARLPRPAMVVAGAVVVEAALLALALANVDVPLSSHDGAFHVETVQALRQGQVLHTWYPLGFHATVAALLALVPWVDTARGTFESAEGLILLAPVALFGLGRSLGLRPLVAAIGAVVLALTYVYPYDNQLWGGWPFSASLLLLMGLWSAAGRWLQRPDLSRAALAGLLAGAILLTHGTELYSAAVGLLVLAGVRWRRLAWGRLARHVPAAVCIGVVCVLPYAAALVGWAHAGGATAVGAQALDGTATPNASGGGSTLEYFTTATTALGAASLIDLPARAVLIGLGMLGLGKRLVSACWLSFTAVVLGAGLLHVGIIDRVYVLTFPWLSEHRPSQVSIMFASLLIGAGLMHGWRWLGGLRSRLAQRPLTWRRLAIASCIVMGFFAEGSAVSVYKTLALTVAASYSYTADDRAAMTWLHEHADGSAVLANNGALDAGIWAPYKANVPVLLPRSAAAPVRAEAEPIELHIADLPASPGLESEACQLHVQYVYAGARELPLDPPLLPDRAVLERAADLQEVFRSGQAVVFKVRLPC